MPVDFSAIEPTFLVTGIQVLLPIIAFAIG